jgi:hypothetical protein
MPSMRRLFPALLALALLPAAPARAGYVGAETCLTCHPEAYAAWKPSEHARATESLSEAQRKEWRCLQCHAPAADQGVVGVSCETCHGGGEWYWPSHVMRDKELARAAGLLDADAKSCGLCHDAGSPSLQAFDPAAKMQLIDHWTADRERRARPAPPAAPPASTPAPSTGWLRRQLLPRPS